MVAFEIKNKVALITGGASGLGFEFALGLLEKGARGITLADYNSEAGNKAIKEIENKYGKNKAIYVKTDISNYEQFEDAFKKTIENFKNIDILINNAGISDDSVWQKQIAINVNGTIHGILLGLESYLPKYKSSSEAVIVNLSSIAGLCAMGPFPIYAATKFAIHGMTLSWGISAHYDRTKVRVVGLCPGMTMTPLATQSGNSLGPAYDKIREDIPAEEFPVQTPQQVVPALTKIIEQAPSGSMWIVEGGEPPYQYELPHRLEISKVHLN